MNVTSLVFSRHAVERMVERRISTATVRTIAESGEVIGDYPDDQPFPSVLLYGDADGQPVHIVVGYDAPTETAYVITTYVPDPTLWYPDWKRRRPR